MKRGEHGDAVGELVVDCVALAMERVQGDNLDLDTVHRFTDPASRR